MLMELLTPSRKMEYHCMVCVRYGRVVSSDVEIRSFLFCFGWTVRFFPNLLGRVEVFVIIDPAPRKNVHRVRDTPNFQCSTQLSYKTEREWSTMQKLQTKSSMGKHPKNPKQSQPRPILGPIDRIAEHRPRRERNEDSER